MKPYLFLLIFSLLISKAGYSQDESFLNFGFGMISSGERDEGYSPLNYSGIGAHHNIGFEKNKSNQNQSGARLGISFSPSKNKFNASLRSYAAKLVQYNLYNIENESPYILKWGWSNVNYFNIREFLDQNNFGGRFDYFTSFGANFNVGRPLNFFDRNFKLELSLQTQLLGFKMQSGYISSLPRGFEGSEDKSTFNKFFNSIDLFYLGNALHKGAELKFSYNLRSGNTIQFAYDYNFSRLQGSHLTVASRGFYYIGLNFKLK